MSSRGSALFTHAKLGREMQNQRGRTEVWTRKYDHFITMLPPFVCHFKGINSSKKQDAANKSNDCAHAWIIYVNQDVLSLIRVPVAVPSEKHSEIHNLAAMFILTAAL